MIDFGRSLASNHNLYHLGVAMLRGHDAKAFDDTDPLETSLGPLPRTHFLPYIENTQPACLLWRNPLVTVLSIGGLKGGRAPYLYYVGAQEPLPATPIPGKINSLAHRWTAHIWNLWDVLLKSGTDRMVFVAHSGGCPVVTYLAALLKWFAPHKLVQVITYGSPKFCDSQFEAYAHGLTVARVHHFGDVVCYLVPSFIQSPIVTVFQNPVSFIEINSAVHCRPGILIKQDVRPVWEEEPQGVTTPIEMSLEDLMNATVRSGVNVHAARTYVNVLLSDLPPRLHTQPAAAPKVRPPFPEGEGIRLPEAARIIEEARQTVVLPNVVRDTNPDAGRITIKKMGGMWYVLIKGEIVYIATSKRDARGVATSMRRFAVQLRQHPERFAVRENLLNDVGGFEPGAFQR